MVRRAGLFTQVRRWRLSRALRAFLLIFSFGMKPLIGALPFLNTCGWTFLRLLKHSKSRHFNLDTIVFCLCRTSIRSPMSFRIVCCCSFCSWRGCWQRMLSCFQVASPSTSVFALTALCYRSVSAGSIHICFRLCFFSAGSHAGRSERHIWIGKIYRYWGRRLNIIHPDLWFLSASHRRPRLLSERFGLMVNECHTTLTAKGFFSLFVRVVSWRILPIFLTALLCAPVSAGKIRFIPKSVLCLTLYEVYFLLTWL